MGLGAALGGIATIGGALIGAKGARSAAATQQAGALQAALIQQQMFEQSRKDLEPFREFGMGALSRYSDIVLKGEMEKFKESPGYQFRLAEGVKALERGAAARGGLLGGRQARALTRFGQDIGSEEYQRYLSQLAYPIQVGQASAAQTAAQNPQFAGQIGQALTGAAEARASGIAGQAGIYSGALGQLGGLAQLAFPRQQQRPSLFGATGGIPPGGFGAATGVPFAYS